MHGARGRRRVRGHRGVIVSMRISRSDHDRTSRQRSSSQPMQPAREDRRDPRRQRVDHLDDCRRARTASIASRDEGAHVGFQLGPTARGVNRSEISLRCFVCSGSSLLIIDVSLGTHTDR